MASIYEQARLTSLALAEDALIRMKDNEDDPDMIEAINDALHSIDRLLAWSEYRDSEEKSN